MFKLQPNPTFKVKVPISVAGSSKNAEIEVEYKYLTKPQFAELFSNVEGKTDLEVLGPIIVGWSGVDQAYSEEALALLLDNYIPAAGELIEAFVNGLRMAKQKN